MAPILEVEGLTVRYGGVAAVSDVSLAVQPGTVTGLIGPNGAGKTTLIDALTGFTHCSGHVRFFDQPVSHLAPHRLAAAGMVRTFQSIELFDDLSVEENVLVCSDRGGWRDALRAVLTRGTAGSERARAALSSLGIDELGSLYPSDLSQGQQKLVGLARALASGPSLVLLDEPAAGFSVGETEELGRRLRSLAAEGVTVLLIDHDMALVLGFCDYVYVLEFGRLIAEGPPDVVRADPRVIAAYLGEADASVDAKELEEA